MRKIDGLIWSVFVLFVLLPLAAFLVLAFAHTVGALLDAEYRRYVRRLWRWWLSKPNPIRMVREMTDWEEFYAAEYRWRMRRPVHPAS